MNNPVPVFVITLAVFCSTLTPTQRVYAGDAAITSEQLSRQITQHQIVRGRFEQWRTLTGIPRPIRSSGHFIYWRDHGLYWETGKPISQASTFTPDAIIHWQSGIDLQQTKRQSDKSSSPVQKQISRILLAVFGGDIQSLEKLFNSYWSTDQEQKTKQWTVELTPTAASIKRVVEKITLSGGDYISNLNLDASNGDTTRIHFTDLGASVYPTANDCPYFDLDSSLCPVDKTGPLPSDRRKP